MDWVICMKNSVSFCADATPVGWVYGRSLGWIRLEQGELIDKYSWLPLTTARVAAFFRRSKTESVCALNSEPAREVLDPGGVSAWLSFSLREVGV
jgi:hypothetical protein